ncbi:hypothetical protein [Psychrobacter sp. M13]|uniref:hypothetical protein n=1 Tax=Psychrobacter sp. M13 TaxID=3067275 RepID=UPI00273B29DB|nr:hypothetical protein [Psychrobacter sp. M13]WLP93376.1 hypothetical protein Q9G97_07090 [Psychrobacter sp. M13]
MSVTIKDLKQAIDQLFPNPKNITEEAIQRACINRHYYLIYSTMLTVIRDNFPQYDMSRDGSFKNTGSHNRVFLVFEEIAELTDSKTAKMLSLQFTNFLTKRHKADYKLDETFSSGEYAQCLRYADRIPELAQALVDEQA